MNNTTKFCQGISDISDTYMGFIIDQWGVLHDGKKIYDGVQECLQELKGRHKSIILISNTTSLAKENAGYLKSLGLEDDAYDHIVTSGELISQGLQNQDESLFKGFGDKCYLFGRKAGEPLLQHTDVEIVDDIKDASFMLIAGVDEAVIDIERYASTLKEGVRHGVKAVCINPDSHSLLGASYLMGPGLIARRYQDFGGIVHYIGKPHSPIFYECIKLLQKDDVYPAQSVMIGDTMAHDIMGAQYVNIDTCLVKSGMHAGVFRNAENPADVDRTLDVLVTHYNHIRPRYLVDKFEWGKALPDRKHKVHKKHVRRKKPEDGDVSDKDAGRKVVKKRLTPRKPKKTETSK